MEAKKMINRFTMVLMLVAFGINNLYAQDDLLELLEEANQTNEKEVVGSVYKATRLILGHSTKTRKQGELELLITHRFGKISSGSHELWGLDNSSMKMNLDYGLTDHINIGLGRSSFDKTFDGFIKYKMISQTKGKGSIPVSVVLLSTIAVRTTPKKEFDPSYDLFKERLAYAYQLIISRKFNPKLSIKYSVISRIIF